MKKQLKSEYSGITIVELVIFIIIIGIIAAPLAVVIANAMRNTVIPEYYTIASALARREIERTTNKRFSAIADEGPTDYTGNFSAYSYQIAVDYVQPGALNTPVVGPTDYKRIKVTIRRAGFEDVGIVTLSTNN